MPITVCLKGEMFAAKNRKLTICDCSKDRLKMGTICSPPMLMMKKGIRDNRVTLGKKRRIYMRRKENVGDLFNNGGVLPVFKMKDMATESYRFLMEATKCHPKEKQNPGRIPGQDFHD